MNHINVLKRTQSRLTRTIIMTSLVVVFFAQSGTVFAHGVLEVKNTDGMVVGWLLNKIPDSSYSSYLTPDGYLLAMSSIGTISNSAGNSPTRLLYEAGECAGQALIESNGFSGLKGEVFQIGTIQDSLFARMQRQVPVFNKTLKSTKINDGVCVALKIDLNTATMAVEEVQPGDYGITESVSGTWRVNILSFDVQLPNLISCDGFEGCL